MSDINPLTPVPAITSRDELWYQNWHHLYSTSVGGKDLSNDAQIRVIGLMEPEVCTKMFKRTSEKLRAKFPATTSGCSKVKIGHLDGAILHLKVF